MTNCKENCKMYTSDMQMCANGEGCCGMCKHSDMESGLTPESRRCSEKGQIVFWQGKCEEFGHNEPKQGETT